MMKKLTLFRKKKKEVGAELWVYLSPINNTEERMDVWRVHFKQGGWSHTITYADPTRMIRATGRGGKFNVKVETLNPYTGNWEAILPLPEVGKSAYCIECHADCAAMVGIVAQSEANHKQIKAHFWTTGNVTYD